LLTEVNDQIESKATELSEFNLSKEWIKEQTDQLDERENIVSALEAKFSRLETEYDERLKSIETESAALAQQRKDLEAEFQRKFDRLQDKDNALEERREQIERQEGETLHRIQGLMRKQKKLEDGLQQLEEENAQRLQAIISRECDADGKILKMKLEREALNDLQAKLAEQAERQQEVEKSAREFQLFLDTRESDLQEEEIKALALIEEKTSHLANEQAKLHLEKHEFSKQQEAQRESSISLQAKESEFNRRMQLLESNEANFDRQKEAFEKESFALTIFLEEGNQSNM